MQRIVIIMPNRKVKIEITNTYYFTPEQWTIHDKRIGEQGASLGEYLGEVCLPQLTTTQVDLGELQVEEEDKREPLMG